MELLLVWAMVVHSAMAGVSAGSYVSVRMPYLNPAGITYASTTTPAFRLQYNSPLQYTNPFQYNSLLQYTNPLHYNSPIQYSHNSAQYAAPLQFADPNYFSEVSYTTPALRQLPAVSEESVAHYHAQKGSIQKVVDVVKPNAVTRRYQVRRPAIQNEFYDIEERIIVRPVGSAVLELVQPVTGTQAEQTRTSKIIHPLPVQPTPTVPPLPSYQVNIHPYPVYQTPMPIYQSLYPSYPLPTVSIPSRPSATLELFSIAPSTLPPEILQDPVDDDSVSVENPENARSRSSPQIFPPQNQAKAEERADPVARNSSQTEATPEIITSATVPTQPRLLSPSSVNPAQSLSEDQVLSRTDSAEHSQVNQQRLIEFLTSRGGVSELVFSPTGLGYTGQVRGRVLSATPAHYSSPPTEQSLNTRRVVVATPIETLQEVEVAEPSAKLHHEAVHQPTSVKFTNGAAPTAPDLH